MNEESKMGNMPEEMDYTFIIDLIDAGRMDDIVDELIDAAVARRKFKNEMKGAVNRISMPVGTRVQLAGDLRPKYLLGVPGTVSSRPSKRRGDIMVELDYRVGRFSKIIGVPASCLELI